MSNIILVGGEKGGVGKSLVARLLSQYMIDHQMPFVAFDSDSSHGSLTRFYRDYSSPVAVDDFSSLDRIVEAAIEVPERRVLVDLAAQTHRPLMRWMNESGVVDMAEESGSSLAYWHVMDTGRESLDLLGRLLAELPSKVALVVVQNQLRGESFALFDASDVRQRALERGAPVIAIKRLHDTVVGKVDATDASFWAATASPDEAPGPLGLMERQRARVWLRHAYDEIARAGV